MKRKYPIIVVLILSLSFCHIQKEPGKVYDLRGKIVQLTKHLVGLSYQLGGEDIDGFDCSGLVYYVYGCFGITVPHAAKKQAKLKNKVTLKHARPGDIVVFKIRRSYHTGIYIGKDTFIHAPKINSPVRQELLKNYWKNHLESVIQLIKE